MFDAEASPAPDLWARIDHELTVQENKDYRKRVLFYRQLAAACFVLFAITGALLGYHFHDGTHQGQSQPTMAALPEPGKATDKVVTPEEAMEAYLQRQSEAAIAKVEPAVKESAPKAAVSPTVTRAPMAPAPAGILPVPEDAQKGSYYNVAPGYSPYLGFGQETARNRGLVSGYAPGSAQAGFGNPGLPSGNRYSQIITWESVTITFGNNPAMGQPAPGSRNLAAKPNTFAEMSGPQSTLRQNQAQQQVETLASKLNKEQEKATEQQKNDGRWSLNLAYAPSYFEQNIGLTEMTRLGGSPNRFGLSSADSDYISVNASEESYKNMTAAREEYKNNTEPAFSYAVEVKAGLKLKDRLKLLTGIGYSESVSRTKSNFIVRQFWVKPRTNELYDMGPSTIFMSALNTGLVSDSISVTPTSEAFATEYKYRHLSIPVGLQYEHDIAKDWFMYVAGGVAANFLIETSVTASHQDVQPVSYSPGDEGSPFRNVQMSSNASLGVGKRISPNLTVALGPEIRNYFNTLVADPENMMAPQGRPYALGLTMGLNYQLSSARK